MIHSALTHSALTHSALIDSALRQVSSASGATLVTTAALMISALTISVEVAWLAVVAPDRRHTVLRSLLTGGVMAVGGLFVGVVYTGVLRWMWPLLSQAAPSVVVALWQRHTLARVLVAFVAWDAIGWLYHRLGHSTAVGRAAHQPHHSGTHFDITLGLRQSWTPVLSLLLSPIMALLGFGLRTVAVVSAVSNLWQLLEHSSAPIRFPRWFAAAVMTPDAHRHHHVAGGSTNLGPVLTVWDRLMGTWVPPELRVPDAPLTGPSTSNPLLLQWAGWRSLLA